MKAAVLTGFGANDCVDVRDVDEPAMRPGCLRVQVCAAGVVGAGWRARCGRRRHLDAVGGDTLMRSFGVVRARGTVVSIAGPPTPQAARENHWRLVARVALWFMSYRARAAARRHGAHYRYLFMRPDGDQLAEIARAIDDGDVRVVTDRVLPLDDVRTAFDHLETGHARGKVVLAVTD